MEDENGDPINLSPENWEKLQQLTNYNDPPVEIFNSFSLTYPQILFDEKQIRVEGDLIKRFKDFDFQKNGFVYGRLLITGMPSEKRTFTINQQNLWLPNATLGVFVQTNKTLFVNINFRDCNAGELFAARDVLFACQPCPLGRFSLFKPNKSRYQQEECSTCPLDKAVNCQGSTITLKPGFWRRNPFTEVLKN